MKLLPNYLQILVFKKILAWLLIFTSLLALVAAWYAGGGSFDLTKGKIISQESYRIANLGLGFFGIFWAILTFSNNQKKVIVMITTIISLNLIIILLIIASLTIINTEYVIDQTNLLGGLKWQN